VKGGYMETDATPQIDVPVNDQNIETPPASSEPITGEQILAVANQDEVPPVTEEPGELEEPTTPANYAFKELRTEAANYKSELDRLDILAKDSGYTDYKAFIEAAESDRIQKSAEDAGVPVEVMQKLNRIDQIEARFTQQETEAQNKQFLSDLDNVKESLGADDNMFNKIVASMDNQGVSVDTLKQMPLPALKNFFRSYMPADAGKQEELKKIDELKNTVPMSNAAQNPNQPNADEMISKSAQSWVDQVFN